MHVDEFNTKAKAKRVKSWLHCISNTIKNVLDVLTDKPLNIYFLFWNVDHKIEVVPRLAPPSKSPYQLNKKEL